MNLDGMSFDGLIKARADALDRVPSQQHIETLGEVLKSLARLDDDTRKFIVEEDEGQPHDLFAYVDAAVAKFPAKPAPEPEPPAPSPWVKVQIGSGTGYRRADDPMLKIMQGFQASDDAALAREIPTWGNPWRAGHENRTRQAIIQNRDPARAAKLKAQAAV